MKEEINTRRNLMLSQSALFPDSNAALLSAGTETAVSENTGLRSVVILASERESAVTL